MLIGQQIIAKSSAAYVSKIAAELLTLPLFDRQRELLSSVTTENYKYCINYSKKIFSKGL